MLEQKAAGVKYKKKKKNFPKKWLLCESEKREYFDLMLGFSFAKNWSIFFLYLFYWYFRKAFLQKQV